MPPRAVCITGVLRRWLGSRGRAVQATGCPDRMTVEFLLWVWRYPRDSRPRLNAALANHDDLDVHELRSRHKADAFLSQLETSTKSSRSDR